MLIPLASAIAPNYFETEILTGRRLTSLSEALVAAEDLHLLGPEVVLLKGIPLSNGRLAMVLSRQSRHSAVRSEAYAIEVDRVGNRSFSGCGDLTSALLTATVRTLLTQETPREGTASGPSLCATLEVIADTMSLALRETHRRDSWELCVVECGPAFLALRDRLSSSPPIIITSPPLHPLSRAFRLVDKRNLRRVAGVIFDLDGTLTEPGAIDFAGLRTRLGLSVDSDFPIMTAIAALPEPEQRRHAREVVVEEEMCAARRAKPREGLMTMLQALVSYRVRVALATRNCETALLSTLTTIGLSPTE